MKYDTLVTHLGRDSERFEGAVNPPVYHVSTVLHPNVAHMEQAGAKPYEGMTYGRFGTPTTQAVEEAVAALEGGLRSIAVPSGLAAITSALGALVSAGDHVLVTDSVYFPTRRYCDTVLARLGVETSYYDPLCGSGIKSLIQPNTKLVVVEAPGSLTFEVQDIPAIAAEARKAGALVVMDNTWATPLHFKPFEKGVDVSLQAATKYIVGHADAMLGFITVQDEALWLKIKTHTATLGLGVGADEAYLGLRGLRTLPLRLERHQENGLLVATWLKRRPEVMRLLHPALPNDAGHAVWKRDFQGACGLFAMILNPVPKPAIDAFLDSLELFGLGFSWGGYESLIIPADKGIVRTATSWNPGGPTIRLHVGLENPDDLIRDLEKGFARLKGG
jgi:cystathionine beta-lyase